MRHGSFQNRNNRSNNNNNRHRSNGGGGQNGGQHRSNNNGTGRPHRNQVLDSNGPDVRVRGTAFQINEKYLTLAKDASSSGDWVLSERYLQHAEHYQRIINEFEPQQTFQTQSTMDGDDGQPSIEPEGEGLVVSTRPTSTPESEEVSEEENGMTVRRPVRRRVIKTAVVQDDDEDLGLPTSILGG